jgi:hypothetical protein
VNGTTSKKSDVQSRCNFTTAPNTHRRLSYDALLTLSSAHRREWERRVATAASPLTEPEPEHITIDIMNLDDAISDA